MSDDFGALKPYTTHHPVEEGTKIPAGTEQRLASKKLRKKSLLQQFGQQLTTIWEINYSLNKFVDDTTESQGEAWKRKHGGKFASQYASSVGASGSTVRDKNGGVSIFPYDLARKMLLVYSKKGDKVVDPFSGHATRMTACFRMGRNYTGYDVSEKFVELNNKIVSNLTKNSLTKENLPVLVMRHQTSEFMVESSDSVDYIFSCPPYWDIENYGVQPHQLANIKNYKRFLEAMVRVMTSCARILKHGRYFCLVIADFRKDSTFYPFHSDLIRLGLQIGFDLHDVIIIQKCKVPISSHFTNQCVDRRRMGIAHEYLLVFKKPRTMIISYHPTAYYPKESTCICGNKTVSEQVNGTHEVFRCSCKQEVFTTIKR